MIRQYSIVRHEDGTEERFAPYANIGYTSFIKKGLSKGKVIVTDHTIDEYEVTIDNRGYAIKVDNARD